MIRKNKYKSLIIVLIIIIWVNLIHIDFSCWCISNNVKIKNEINFVKYILNEEKMLNWKYPNYDDLVKILSWSYVRVSLIDTLNKEWMNWSIEIFNGFQNINKEWLYYGVNNDQSTYYLKWYAYWYIWYFFRIEKLLNVENDNYKFQVFY